MQRRGLFIICLIWGLVLGFAFLALAQPAREGCPLWQRGLKEIVISGQVVNLSFPVATIEADDGRRYQVRLGPWWFWAEKDYQLKTGEWVKIEGFVSGDLVFPKVIRTPDRVLRLRDKRGFPLWRRRPRWGGGMRNGASVWPWWMGRGRRW